MKKIPLSQGKFAIVDDEDFDYLSQWKWFLNGKGYAIRSKRESFNEPRPTFMHRVVNKTPVGFETDHIDGDRLNNQKHNLRSATVFENQRNRKKTKGNSKYKGVSWHKDKKIWRSYIMVNSSYLHLGYFKCEDAAAVAYNIAAKEKFGEFAKLNCVKI